MFEISEENKLNIYQKLARIRKTVEVLQKDKSGYGYKYVSEDAILAGITGQMDKLNISLIPMVVPETSSVTPYSYLKTKVLKNGDVIDEHVNDIIVKAEMMFVWINNDDPSDRIEIPWVIVGQQSDASQAFGSGLTYCSRYFLLKYFQVATPEDDPDKWRSLQSESIQRENRMVSSKIIEQVVEFINTHLDKNPKDRDDIISIVRKYAKKDGKPVENPKAITDPETASKLYAELTEKYAQK